MKTSWKILIAIAVMAAGLLAASAQPQSNVPVIRLAIISDEPSAGAAADLLTAELSRIPSLQLLERNDIARIRREQALSVANGDFVKLGQILGADGLLLLEPVQEGTNHFLTTRLVAVSPGVVLSSTRTPWPAQDVEQWTRVTVGRFAPLIPKLGVLARDAIPLSVVNLRSAVRNAQSEDLETRINTLAVERLTQQPELFVLERRRMDLLSDEKDFKDARQTAFWNGSYLLDGTIDRDGYAEETATIDARLTPPRGAASISFRVTGSRTNLTQLVNQLADRVAQELQLHADTNTWNPASEADQYFDEAKWASRWGMIQEAESAANASWSLGRESRDTAQLRIATYVTEATSGWPGFGTLEENPLSWTPDSNKLAPAIIAARLYESAFHSFLASDTKPDMNWYDLGMDLLNTDSTLLDQFYDYGREGRRENETELAELRSLLRSIAGLLGEQPAYKSVKQTSRYLLANMSVGYDFSWWGEPFDLTKLTAAEGGLWYDTPEGSLEMYRGLVRSGAMHRLRGYVPYVKIPDWTSQDGKRASDLWQAFVQELCESTNGLTKVDGYYLAFFGNEPDPQYRDAAYRLLDVALTNSYDIVAAGLQDQLFKDIEAVLRNTGGGLAPPPIQWEVHQRYWNDFRFDLTARAAAKYFRVDTNYFSSDFERFGFPLQRLGDGFLGSQARVREVLVAMENYEARMPNPLTRKPPDYNYQNNFDSVVRWLKRALPEEASAPASPETPPPPRVIAPNPFGNFPNTSAAPPPPTVTSNAFHATRFWRVPSGPPVNTTLDFPDVHLVGGKYRGDRFWLEVLGGRDDEDFILRAEPQYVGTELICGVDLRDFQAKIIPVPLDVDHPPGASFEVVGDAVFVTSGNKVRRYSQQAGTWDDLPYTVPDGLSLSAVNGRLFMISVDSILELNTNTGSADVLASARRRPAMNILDNLSWGISTGYPQLLPGPGGSLRALFQGKLYSRGQDGAWSQSDSLSDFGNGLNAYDFKGGMIVNVMNRQRDTSSYLLRDDRTNFELAIVETSQPADQFRVARPPTAGVTQKPLWQSANPGLIGMSLPALDGDTLWFFTGRLSLKENSNVDPFFNDENGRHAMLVEFKRNQSGPRMLPLWFDLKPGMVTREAMSAFRQWHPETPTGLRSVFFQPTPQGLVYAADNLPGFWFLPTADLDAAPSPGDPNAALLAAAEAGDAAAAAAALTNQADVDTRNFRGWTPLIIAAKAGNLSLARVLIAKGADVNARSTAAAGSTVLIFAASADNPGLIDELLKHGAKVNAPGANGLTPILNAVMNHSLASAQALIAGGADIEALGPANASGWQLTPLMVAATLGDTNMVGLLLAKGADLERINNHSATALMAAAMVHHPETLGLLIARGAKVNAAAPDGHTALIYAAYAGETESVRLLLAAGADPNATAVDSIETYDTPKRYDAAAFARIAHHPEAMALILQAQQQSSAGKSQPKP